MDYTYVIYATRGCHITWLFCCLVLLRGYTTVWFALQLCRFFKELHLYHVHCNGLLVYLVHCNRFYLYQVHSHGLRSCISHVRILCICNE